eukprot:scaffold2844_cov326-Pavlova_lutheri.AAC.28
MKRTRRSFNNTRIATPVLPAPSRAPAGPPEGGGGESAVRGSSFQGTGGWGRRTWGSNEARSTAPSCDGESMAGVQEIARTGGNDLRPPGSFGARLRRPRLCVVRFLGSTTRISCSCPSVDGFQDRGRSRRSSDRLEAAFRTLRPLFPHPSDAPPLVCHRPCPWVCSLLLLLSPWIGVRTRVARRRSGWSTGIGGEPRSGGPRACVLSTPVPQVTHGASPSLQRRGGFLSGRRCWIQQSMERARGRVRPHFRFVTIRQALGCRLQHLLDGPRRDPSTRASVPVRSFDRPLASIAFPSRSFFFVVAGGPAQGGEVHLGRGRIPCAARDGVGGAQGSYGCTHERHRRVQARRAVRFLVAPTSLVLLRLPLLLLVMGFCRCASFQQELVRAMDVQVSDESQRRFRFLPFLFVQVHHATAFPPAPFLFEVFHRSTCILGFVQEEFGSIPCAFRVGVVPWTRIRRRHVHDLVFHTCIVQGRPCTWRGLGQHRTRTSVRFLHSGHEQHGEGDVGHQQVMDVLVRFGDLSAPPGGGFGGVPPCVVRAAKGLFPSATTPTAAGPHVGGALPGRGWSGNGRFLGGREASQCFPRVGCASIAWERRRGGQAQQRLARAVPRQMTRARGLRTGRVRIVQLPLSHVRTTVTRARGGRGPRAVRAQQGRQVGASRRCRCVCLACHGLS